MCYLKINKDLEGQRNLMVKELKLMNMPVFPLSLTVRNHELTEKQKEKNWTAFFFGVGLGY